MSGQGMPGSGAMAPTQQGGGQFADMLRQQSLGQGGGAPPFNPLPQPGAAGGGYVGPPQVGPPRDTYPKPPYGTGGSGGVDNHPPQSGGTDTAPPGGGAPPFRPPGMGGVDAGYGQGPLNAQGMQSPLGGPMPKSQAPTPQPGLKQNAGGSPPFAPPVATPPQGMQNKMSVHNPTGAGATQASQMAAVKRPIPSTAPKAQGMMPPTPQTAGTGKK